MVTATVRMVHRVHRHTAGLGPVVALGRELVLGARRLCPWSACSLVSGFRTQQRLVRSSASRHDADHATHVALDHLLRAARELDARLAFVGVVADDGDVVSARAAELALSVGAVGSQTTYRATIANLLLDVAHDGSFREGADGQDVANGQGRVLAGVDELASVHSLVASTVSDAQKRTKPYAMKVSVCILNLYGLRKTTLARGAPRPESWMIYLTMPRMYPCRSACHCKLLCAVERWTHVVQRPEFGGGFAQPVSISAAPHLHCLEYLVCAVNIEPRPFLWFLLSC